MPHSRSDGQRWENAFAYIESLLATTDPDRLLIAELERHALMMTLAAFPTTFSDPLRRPAQRSAAPITVRRALAYIDQNAHLPITIDDVARAAFISSRGLQYAFRRALDITPTQAIRRARLDGARRDLLNGDVRSVADAARRWGFSNASRFTLAYRDVYGAPPPAP